MPRYLDPKNDLTFKRVFGEHKHLCVSLLNALLPLEKGRQVVGVEYQTGELLPRFDGVRNSIVDVRCEDNEGRQFIVEMQMYWTTSFQQRVMLNASKAYVAQFEKGLKDSNPYRLLKPVYALNFVNDIFMPDKAAYYHHYAMVNVVDTEQRIDGLTLVFIELPKFNPDNRAIRKLRDLWLLYLTAIDRGAEQVPPELLEQPDTNDAVHILEEQSYTRLELASYDRYLDAIATEKTQLADSREEGHAEGLIEGEAVGLAKGRAEGEVARARENALVMLKDGMPPETVAKYSGLAVSEVMMLARSVR